MLQKFIGENKDIIFNVIAVKNTIDWVCNEWKQLERKREGREIRRQMEGWMDVRKKPAVHPDENVVTKKYTLERKL